MNNCVFSSLAPVAVHEVDGAIMAMKNLLSSAPRSDPMRPVLTHALAIAQTAISGQEEYLNEAILHFTEAIFLPFTAGQSLNIVQVLFYLSRAFLCRSEKSTQPEDVELSIEYLRYLHGLPLDVLDVPRRRIPTLLVQALAIRVKSNADDVTDGLEEMVSLCRGLLASDVSAGYPTTAITSLTGALVTLLTVFNRWGAVPPLDQTIECLREALEKCPPGPYSDEVSPQQSHRFQSFRR
jgi:hypothetical protein